MPVSGIPTYSEVVKQNYLIEPLTGAKDVFHYIENFPYEIYTKSADTHLYKFMRSLLGDAGVNWLRKNQLDARVMLEEMGLDAFDLDAFFGNPFAFGRIADEIYEVDTTGLISREQDEIIKSKNARYRNRALDYINGARAGNTPLGMKLIAQAGLGHAVEIVENYKYLFDSHSDDPLGLEYRGTTVSTEEMIVLPRREIGVSEEQVISFSTDPDFPIGGEFSLVYNGLDSTNYPYTYDDGAGPVLHDTIPWNGTTDHVRLALEAIPTIGEGNVEVVGGPGPVLPWTVRFVNHLANIDVPELQAGTEALVTPENTPSFVTITTQTGGKESVDETVWIPPKSQYQLQQAVDRVRPQTTIMTVATAPGLRERNNWNQAFSSSEYTEVVKFVSGNPKVIWPAVNNIYWLEQEVEKEAPRITKDYQYHYTNFHNITGASTSSNPVEASRILADYDEPLFITSATETTSGTVQSFINGIYPQTYKDFPGVPPIRYAGEQEWASVSQPVDEWVELTFAEIEAVNYVTFEIARQPVTVNVFYDAMDGDDAPVWTQVTPVEPFGNFITTTDFAANGWETVALTFSDPYGGLLYSRGLRLELIRRESYTGSIRIRNLRVARNVS